MDEPADPFVAPAGQAELVAALQAGDEAAFAGLVDELGPSMLRVARMYVSTRAVAEEVVQETWLAVLTGIDRFEGRSSLKTWIFRILANRAKTRGEREGRTLPFSSIGGATTATSAPSTPTASCADGHWGSPPTGWADAARGQPRRQGDARGRAGGDRGAARDAACGDHDAGRRRLGLRRGA